MLVGRSGVSPQMEFEMNSHFNEVMSFSKYLGSFMYVRSSAGHIMPKCQLCTFFSGQPKKKFAHVLDIW